LLVQCKIDLILYSANGVLVCLRAGDSADFECLYKGTIIVNGNTIFIMAENKSKRNAKRNIESPEEESQHRGDKVSF